MNKVLLKLLEQVAQEYNTTIFDVKKSMEQAIDEAWNNGNPNAEFAKLFKNKRPSMEEFILKTIGRLTDE